VAVWVAETENLRCVVPATRPELRYVTAPGSLMETLLVAACVSIFVPPTATAQPAAHVPAGESVTSVFCLMASAARTQQRGEQVHRRHPHALVGRELAERRHRNDREHRQDDDCCKQLDKRYAASTRSVVRQRIRDVSARKAAS
jgi:hypothetical protein